MAFSEDLASARRISSSSQEEPLINLDLQSLQRYNDFTLEILKNIQEQDKRHQENQRAANERQRAFEENQRAATERQEENQRAANERQRAFEERQSDTITAIMQMLQAVNKPSGQSALQPGVVAVAHLADKDVAIPRPEPAPNYKLLPSTKFHVAPHSLTPPLSLGQLQEHQSSINKPLTDLSHQANNIEVVLRPFRVTHTALNLGYELSTSILRLDPCNQREPLRLTPTPVSTSLGLAPVLPRPPSTALT